jgi:hypothetical protein
MVWQKVRNVVVAAVALSACAGCLTPLSYRPPKPKAAAAPVVKKENLHLPPSPDIMKNNATLAGIDTTGVGVRDDVHIRIFSNYSSPTKRAVMMEIGKALQTVMANPPKTVDEAKRLQQPLVAALLKLQEIPGVNNAECRQIESELYLATVNTPARSKAFLQHSLLLPAESWTLPKTPALAQADGAAKRTPAISVPAAPSPAVTPATSIAKAPEPGKTPGYGTSSVYGSVDDATAPAAAPANSAASKPAASGTPAASAAMPTGKEATSAKETTPGKEVPPVSVSTKGHDTAAASTATPTVQATAAAAPKSTPVATPADDGFLEP